MALPADLTTATVTAQFFKGDGTPETGTVSLERTVYLRGASSDVTITPHIYKATLDGMGRISIVLPVTNDSSYVPVGWEYTVSESLSGRSRQYVMPLTADIDLARVSPIETVASLGTQYLPLNGGIISGSLAVEGNLTAKNRDVLAELTSTAAAASGAATTASGAATTANAALPKSGGTVTGTLKVGAIFTVDPTTGVATQGGKNGFAPLRFCGIKPTGGAPTVGTWEFGDVIMTTTGSTWLCTIAGTPGTWAST